MFARKASIALASAALGTVCLAVPAHADPCTELNPANGCTSASVTGTVTVPVGITLSLSGTSFTLNATPGATVNTGTSPYVSTATVMSNDPQGYAIVQGLDEANPNGFPGTVTGDLLSSADIYPLMQAGYASNWQLGGPFLETYQSTTVSAANGDQIGLAWQFTIPGNQPADTYSGTIDVLAIAQ